MRVIFSTVIQACRTELRLMAQQKLNFINTKHEYQTAKTFQGITSLYFGKVPIQ